MPELSVELNTAVPLDPLLGYLNFSEGKPDPRFQKAFNDAYSFLAQRGSTEPWNALNAALSERLAGLHASGVAAFRSKVQAEAVLRLAFAGFLPAYRRHHADLLFHLSDAELFQPFFLVRVLEAILAQGGPWSEDERIIAGTLAKLNDFVGHRPIAILQTRSRAEPYDHERFRPIPLYLRGAGCAWGRYRELLERALAILDETEPAILQDACFELDLLDELALDPRAYDHTHPVNRRSNYIFGEWDPHHLDLQGRYRRFVVRQLTLDAVLDRVAAIPDVPQGELFFEAAAVLAGTILMASGICGAGPSTHDSTTSLSTLIPRVARYRDAFYQALIIKTKGAHAERLREEMARTKQPLGGARQHLNQYLGRHRAAQLQTHHLALIFAAMGYPDSSRRQAARIPAVSIRFLSEIQIGLTTCRLATERGELTAAADLLLDLEGLLHRGIAVGALPDPWNILGFQALFPLSQAQEDAVRDTRIDALINITAELFALYDRLLCEAAGRGATELVGRLTPPFRRLAAWWDRFASVEVSDVRHVHGASAVDSALHVAQALGQWHARGAASADLAFWRDQQESFRLPQAYGRVVDALLRKKDYRAAMALLATWLGQAEQVPLEEGEFSFHALALCWLLGLLSDEQAQAKSTHGAVGPEQSDTAAKPATRSWPLIKKFLDYLEANAEDYWHVPRLDLPEAERSHDRRDSLFEAAYEGVTFQDSAADDREGAVAEGGTAHGDFALEEESPRLAKRLAFLATVAQLWLIAARSRPESAKPDIASWFETAQCNYRQLLALLDELHAYPIPAASGSQDAFVEYDRRRQIKDDLLNRTIDTSLATFLAVNVLRGMLGDVPGPADTAPWAEAARRLEQALLRGAAEDAHAALPEFVERFRAEPLVFKPWAAGGQPRQILQARIAVHVLRALTATLPRLGLLSHTFQLLLLARAMEHAQQPTERGITQFNELFETGFRAMAEAVVESGSFQGQGLCEALERLAGPCFLLWVEHSRTVQTSVLESVQGEAAWAELHAFVKRYGGDLFNNRFLTPGNLRGILHQGAGVFLDYLRDNPDPLRPIRLVEEVDRKIPRDRAVQFLQLVAQAVVDNYAEFKDYHQTSPQSAYGENLFILLDFLQVKASYERHVWILRPLYLIHDVLIRASQHEAAVHWRERCAEHQRQPADEYVARLRSLEQTYGIRLATVADRIGERFVRPLDLDRLCGLVEPAMAEAGQPEHPAFDRFEGELAVFADQPSGVGLDTPPWLQRLALEVNRVRARQSSLVALAEHWLQVPRIRLTAEEFQKQIEAIQPATGEPEREEEAPS